MSNRKFVGFCIPNFSVCKHMHACKIKTKTKLKVDSSHSVMP